MPSLSKFKVSGLGMCACGGSSPRFSVNPQSHAVAGYPKSKEVGRKSNTLLIGQAGLSSVWENPPARLHTARAEQGFRMISPLSEPDTQLLLCCQHTGFQLLKFDPREDVTDTLESCKALETLF